MEDWHTEAVSVLRDSLKYAVSQDNAAVLSAGQHVIDTWDQEVGRLPPDLYVFSLMMREIYPSYTSDLETLG
jgi:hypothetical protein